jgi:hypothetical protein
MCPQVFETLKALHRPREGLFLFRISFTAEMKPFGVSVISLTEGYPVGLQDREASSCAGDGG